jgi:hypothetical protein
LAVGFPFPVDMQQTHEDTPRHAAKYIQGLSDFIREVSGFNNTVRAMLAFMMDTIFNE